MYTLNDYVKINNTNIEGKIIKLERKKVIIYANDKYIKTNITNITKTNKKVEIVPKTTVNLKVFSPPIDEIMIRHQTVDEALENLDKFIDNAICNNVKIVKIIHGKRGGILRKEVHKYLENNPYIKEHRLGGYYEGSYGVTIAFLK